MLTVTDAWLAQGVYTARLTGSDTAPALVLMQGGAPLPELEVRETAPGQWTASCPLPARLLSDGVQTLLLTEAVSADVLHRMALQAGTVLDGDVMAEIALLRDELDLVKAALRRLIRERDV